MHFKFCPNVIRSYILIHLFLPSKYASRFRVDNDANYPLEPSDFLRMNVKTNTENLDFVIVRKLMTWTEAQDACESICTVLSFIPSYAHLKAISGSLYRLSAAKEGLTAANYFNFSGTYEIDPARRYWTGLNDLSGEGNWVWSIRGYPLNAKEASQLWYPGQPDHFGADGKMIINEHCVTLWNPTFYNFTAEDVHSLNDDKCSNRYYGLCAPQGGVPGAGGDPLKLTTALQKKQGTCPKKF